jgi:GTPase SAR1 family protein
MSCCGEKKNDKADLMKKKLKTSQSKDTFKITICGDQAVGKTSLISYFKDKTFNQNTTPTIGVDFISF